MNDNQIEVLSKAVDSLLLLRAVIARSQKPDMELAKACRIRCWNAAALAEDLEAGREWQP